MNVEGNVVRNSNNQRMTKLHGGEGIWRCLDLVHLIRCDFESETERYPKLKQQTNDRLT